jgi:hypothetical protein
MSVLAGLAAGGEALKSLSDAIDALKKIQKWLFVQPKEAAAELSRVIGEVMKATPATTEAVDKLLQVIDEAKPNLSTLAQVGDGSLRLRINTIRPHCHDIDLVARQYLWQWLRSPELRDLMLSSFGTSSRELGRTTRTISKDWISSPLLSRTSLYVHSNCQRRGKAKMR